MQPPFLIRKDVHLRPLQPNDAAAWLKYLTDPVAVELTSYDVQSIETVNTMIAEYANRGAYELTRWAIARLPEDVLIGTCGFHSWSSRDRRAELGYDLSPESWGRGIATDAVAAAVNAAFKDTALNRVDAFVMVENVGSQRVLEKCGFEREGRLARYRNCRGNFRDFYLYARVRAA